MNGQIVTGAVLSALKNWKTSVVGLSTAFFAFVLFSPEDFKALPLLQHVAKFWAAGGLAALGLVAKDVKFAPTGDHS